MRSLIILFIAFMLQACSVAMTVPVSRFDTPEVTGQIGKFRVSAGYGTATETVFTSDYTVLPPDPASPSVFSKPSLGFLNAQAGLMPWLDIAYKSFNYVQAKAQFLGRPELDAEAGNLSAAFTAAYGFETETASSNEFLGSGVASYKLNQHKTDTALIVGYRTSEMIMVYGGPYIKWIEFDGNQKTYAAGVSSNFNGKSRLLGGNAGVRITKLGQPTFIGMTVYLELGYYSFKTGASSVNGGSFGTAFEFQL